MGIFYVSVILLVIEPTLSEIFLLLTSRGLIRVKRMHALSNGFYIWKCPGSVQDLLLWLIQPHEVIPVLHDWKIIVRPGVTSKVVPDAAIRTLLGGDLILETETRYRV